MKTTIILFSLFLFSATSCKKKGCIDPIATNYNSEAKKDDGSCEYAPTSQELLIGSWKKVGNEQLYNGQSGGFNPNSSPEEYSFIYSLTNWRLYNNFFNYEVDNKTYSWKGDSLIFSNNFSYLVDEISATKMVLVHENGAPNIRYFEFYEKL